jgi:hypothetical protein
MRRFDPGCALVTFAESYEFGPHRTALKKCRPGRLADTHVPGGWKPPGVKTL